MATNLLIAREVGAVAGVFIFGNILCLIFFLEAALALGVLHSLVHEARRLHHTAAGQAMVRRRLAAEVGMMVSAKRNYTIKKF